MVETPINTPFVYVYIPHFHYVPMVLEPSEYPFLILYYQYKTDFMKGGGHGPTGEYDILLLSPLLITTFPPHLSP